MKPTFRRRSWYPSLISSESSYVGGDVNIYYADGVSPGEVRQLTRMRLNIAFNL